MISKYRAFVLNLFLGYSAIILIAIVFCLAGYHEKHYVLPTIFLLMALGHGFICSVTFYVFLKDCKEEKQLNDEVSNMPHK